MPLYSYKAKALSGEKTIGEREAASRQELVQLLRKDGFIALSIEERAGKTAPAKKTLSVPAIAPLYALFNRISLKEKMLFTHNLGVMVQAGLSLTRALEVLERQSTNRVLKTAVRGLVDHIRKGESFAESLSAYPGIFPPLFRAMVAAGETSGKLDNSLETLTIQMKNDYELRRRVRGAMVYPLIILIAMVVIGILMLVYVVPTLVSTFEELEIDLPTSTRLIVGASSFIVNNVIIVLLALPVLGYLPFFLFRFPPAKRIFDVFIVRIPVIGEIVKKIQSARTTRTMSSLITSGVPIVKSLEITKDVLQNHLYKEVIERASEDIQKGKTIADAFMAHTHLYPVLVGEMMAVGEETGKIAEMLERLATFYESEVAATTKDLSSIIEPLLMIIIGAVVGFFAVSMIAPLYTSLSGGF